MNNQANMVYQTREGDFALTVVESGFSRDADFMITGWIYTTRDGDTYSRASGLMWDTSRILVYCSQPLTAREVDALRAAGFMVDDSFCP